MKEQGKAKRESGVEEAAISYETKMHSVSKTKLAIASNRNSTVQKMAILYPQFNQPEYQMSSFEKIALIQAGITKNALEHFKALSCLDYQQLSQILSVARATLINKKGDNRFDDSISEKVMDLADLYSYGIEVLESPARLNAWIAAPNRALGDKPPFSLLDTFIGRQEVKSIIGRIDYGVYS